jgi:type II secretory pathway component GspD/PulD (secretin)
MQRIKIVADERINALVIGGNRADRKIIEELLGVFDSKDLIDRLQRITPILVPLQSASAKNVSDIVKEVYKSQLSSGAGRDPLDIPEGVSSDVATILQQINAQSSAPLLTLSVDESSNTLVLRGASDLTEEVKAFISSLDQQAASAPARRIQVLRLESTNSKNLEKALKLLYGK